MAGDAGAKAVYHLEPKEDGGVEKPLQNLKFMENGMGTGSE